MNEEKPSKAFPKIPEPLLTPYNPVATEERIYKAWEASGFFNPDNLPARHTNPYTIIMPPPNANGRLHAGHALFITVEDIMIRYKRMRGYKTLWVPGADHAGFETQVVYEKKLEKEGRSRFKMDRDELYKEIMAFTLENKVHMENGVRALGASCDWSREKFTLDPGVVAKVQETFQKMYDDGLIYRGNRLVNWCTKHQTSLSDVETESIEQVDPLYYMKYGPFTLATVRPETKFGDTAIAVNPTDERYKAYIGTEIEIETLIGKAKLKVIGDDFVDKEFGTGVVKVTPAHDPNDYEMALRHNLPAVEVIDAHGKLNEKAGAYAGLKIKEARKKVAEDLETAGLMVKVDKEYKHIIKTCYKCGSTIEPRLLPQWFVKMGPLAKLAVEAVENGSLTFIPDNYRKIFLYWMNNALDWNISRQIVWGIPVPAKICTACAHAVSDHVAKDTCEKCGAPMKPDTDTFDTWFSSGQWPLLSLNYPEGADYKTFYPTDVMETGSDLIFKWVPRMVIFGLYLAKDVPFRTVYMHGLVNDAQGKKMSKSKGNVVDPLELTSKYGTDALRMALIVGNTPGTDIALAENKIKGYKNFANKLWNMARFILSALDNETHDREFTAFSAKDTALRTERDALFAEITLEMDAYKFHLVSEKLYHYAWHTLADNILEETKTILATGTPEERRSRQQFLIETLKQLLAALHPFMPFVTEEIWRLLGEKEYLMISPWPAKK